MVAKMDSFGQTLRTLRLDAGIGLRELARLIDKSPGYLSDVELGNVPPPSEGTIVQIAGALAVDKKSLLAAAKKVDPELARYITEHPEAADFLRTAKDRDYKDDDWQRLAQLAKLSRLGKVDESKK